MVRRVPGCLHVVCAIWTLGFETKSQVVETVEINDSSKAEEQQAILAKAPKDAESATASNGLSLEVSALPDALPRALRSTSSSQSKNFISAQSDLEVGLGSLGQLQQLQQLQGLEAQSMRQLEDSKNFDSNHNLADLASQNKALMESIPVQGTWDSKTKSPPSPSCPTCCRGSLKEVCPEDVPESDPCASASICTGFHRCFGAKRGFLQCQPKPDSEVLCQTGPNCLPECLGKKLGNDDDDCALQPVNKCEGYVWRRGRATQCRVKPGGNPSGADICSNAHICGER